MTERPGLPTAALSLYLEVQRDEILASYGNYLQAGRNPLGADPGIRDQVIAHGAEMLDEVISALGSDNQISAEGSRRLPRQIGAARAEAGLPVIHSLRAFANFFRIVTEAMKSCPGINLEMLSFGMLVLNECIATRTGEAGSSYSDWLLSRVHEALVEERRHLARDLHDRVSAGINAAYRQLELYDIGRPAEPTAADRRVESARDALVHSMQEIRKLTAGLRAEEVEDLEKSLRDYLDSLRGEVAADLMVSGDETWARPNVREQVFLIIREALRNALQHGHPGAVFVRVAIAPHELWATIDDDGAGFDPTTCGQSGGSGVQSMAERAALLGGAISVSSRPGHGTNIELRVPLGDAQKESGPVHR